MHGAMGSRDPRAEMKEEYAAALKQEVLRRVTARLQEENHKDQVVDQLSERILQRITSK